MVECKFFRRLAHLTYAGLITGFVWTIRHQSTNMDNLWPKTMSWLDTAGDLQKTIFVAALCHVFTDEHDFITF